MQNKLVDLLKITKGKKTYIVLIAAFVIGVLEGLEVYAMPMKGWLFLSLIGAGTIKAYANRVEALIKEYLKKQK